MKETWYTADPADKEVSENEAELIRETLICRRERIGPGASWI